MPARKYFATLLVPILLILQLAAVASEDVSLAEIFPVNPPEKVTVGDRVHFRVSVDAGLMPQTSSLIREKNKDFTVLDVHSPVNEGGRVHFDFIATAYKAGPALLGSISIMDAQGKLVAKTDEFSMEITSILKEGDKNPVDIRNPLGIKPSWKWYALFIGLPVFLALIALYFLVRYLRKRKPAPVRKTAKKKERLISPFEKACGKLQELGMKNLVAKGDFKKHYFALTEIVKEYLSERLKIDVLEATTAETEEKLTLLQGMDNSTVQEYMEYFLELDMTKFTDLVPPRDKAESTIRRAREILDKTERRMSGRATPQS